MIIRSAFTIAIITNYESTRPQSAAREAEKKAAEEEANKAAEKAAEQVHQEMQ